MRPRSIRAQITMSVVLVVTAFVALSGLVIVLRIDHRDRDDVDRQLVERAGRVREDAGKLLSGPPIGVHDGPAAQDDYGGLLAGSQSLVRLISAGEVVAARGEQPTEGVPIPADDGFSTLTVGDEYWRSLVEPVDGAGEERLQVLQSLEPLEQRLNDNRQIVAGVAVLAAVATALGVWVVTGLVLQPLRRLRAGAMRIRPGEVGQRLPEERRPQEVADLSATLNGMLERLQSGVQATRRFTADAGHELRTPLTSLGADLETLLRNPGISASGRQEALAAMAVEHRRIVMLLDGLQMLARGDAGALPNRSDIDLVELVHDAVDGARRRFPAVRFRLEANPGVPVMVEGWEAGLLLAIRNLLDNAALHGRPAGTVDVVLTAGGNRARIAVSDDGAGIPPEDRHAMKQRFARGRNPRSSGSGLGLPLVEQQAELHGGTLDLSRSASGGLRATLVLPVQGSTARP